MKHSTSSSISRSGESGWEKCSPCDLWVPTGDACATAAAPAPKKAARLSTWGRQKPANHPHGELSSSKDKAGGLTKQCSCGFWVREGDQR